MWKRFINFLNEPFASDEGSPLKTAFLTGLGISLFLFLFKPFGIENEQERFMTYIIAYGLITFGVTLIFSFFQKRIIDEQSPSFTFWKWIVGILILITFIAIGNYLLWHFMNGFSGIYWPALFRAVYVTLLVGLFPICISGAYRLYVNKGRYMKMADAMEQDLKTHVDSTKETIAIADMTFFKNEFLFAEAMENYVNIHLGNSRSNTIRITLTALENILNDYGLLRCHRSYIVNTEKVVSVSGNAQGLKLKLAESEQEVPVSRKYIPLIRENLA